MAYFPVVRSAFDSSKNFLAAAALLLAGAALLAGCHPAVTDPTDPKFVVAEKPGDWQILRGELDSEVGSYLKDHQTTAEQVGPSKMPLVETAMLKSIVLKKLMLERAAAVPLTGVDQEEAAQLDAIKQRVPPGQDFEQQLKAAGMSMDDLKERIHQKILITKLLEAEAFKNLDPTDQEINDVYLKNKDSFNIPEKVRASRILILVDDKTSPADLAAKKAAIDKARDRVVHGEDFSKVAMEVSEDRYSAPKGGDINFFQRGENEPGFDDVAFTTKENALSPVFLTSLGYQFLKVTAIQPPGVAPVAEARAYITSKLRQMKTQEQEQAYAKKLLADSGVVYHFVLVEPPAPGAPPAEPAGSDGAQPSPVPESSESAAPAEAPPAAANSNGAPGK